MNHLLPRLFNRLKIINYINFNHTITKKDKKIKIPIIKRIGFGNWGQEEQWMDDVLSASLNKYNISQFVDIGANIGQTLVKAKTIKPELDYYAVEPNPACIFYMRALIKENSFKNTFLINCAIGMGEEFQYLQGYGDTDTRATLQADKINNDNIVIKFLTPVHSLDNLLKYFTCEKNFLLKIDVEGKELNVLKSGTNTLNNLRPIIICEILPHNNNSKEMKNQETILSYLNDNNYRLQLIKSGGTPEDFNPLNNISEISKSNYLLLPNELLDK